MRLYSSFGNTVVHRDATNANGWSERKPRTSKERRSMSKKCFLITTPKRNYPICANGTDLIDCVGLIATHQRANLILRDPRKKRPEAIQKAKIARDLSEHIGKKHMCSYFLRKTKRSSKKKVVRNSRFG